MKELKFKIIHHSTATWCDYDPDGFAEEMIVQQRSKYYHGFFSSFSLPMTFKFTDAKLIKGYYLTDFNTPTYVQVWKRNILTNIHELKYTGKIDYGQDFVIGHRKVTVRLIDGDINQDFKNNETTKYDIGIGEYQALRFDGLVDNFETPITASQPYYNDYDVNGVVDNFLPEGNVFEHNFKDLNGGYVSFDDNDVNGIFLRILKDCRIKINMSLSQRKIDLKNFCAPGAPYEVEVVETLVRIRGGVYTQLQKLSTTTITVTTTPTTHTINAISSNHDYPSVNADEIECLDGDEFAVYVYLYNPFGTHFQGLLSYTGLYSHYYTVRIFAPLKNIYGNYEKDNFWVMTPKRLFEQLALAIGGYTVKSDYLDDLVNIKLSSINIAFDKRLSITTSMKDFFDFLNSFDDVGLGTELIDGIMGFRLERLSYFFDNTQTPATIGNCGTRYQLTTASDFIIGKISIGQENYSYGTAMGYQEFMGKMTFSPTKSVQNNEFNFVSPYRFDNAGFDSARLKMLSLTDTSNTKDTDSDSDIFVFDCNFVETIGQVDYYKLNRDDISITTSGFKYPERAFNLAYTPHRNLIRKLDFIKSCAFGIEEINCNSFEKYPYLITTDGVTSLTEVSTQDLTTGTEYFYPLELSCELPLTDLADFDKLRSITILVNGYEVEVSGFITDIGIKFLHPSTYNVKLLLSSLNDLNYLI